ncbi:MAG: hypothetical protein ACJ8EI_06095 [Sphingomicrobium sp.]
MSRPLSRPQTLENRAFLKVLRRLGNVRLACRELGLKYGTMQHRRKVHPAFAARWAAALAAAQARLGQVGLVGPAAGRPLCSPLRAERYATTKGGPAAQRSTSNGPTTSFAGPPPHACGAGRNGSFRTLGGEMVIVRTRGGKFQMRRAQPGKLTREAEQHFLATLGTTCNVRLAAAAVGAAEAAFFRRRRRPGFDEAMREAIEAGYDHLEAAMIRSAITHLRGGEAGAAAPAVTGMTAQLALSLLGHYRKTARLPEQYQPYDVEKVRERLERKMRVLGLLNRPDSSGAGEGVV